jgi:hypothetical protein
MMKKIYIILLIFVLYSVDYVRSINVTDENQYCNTESVEQRILSFYSLYMREMEDLMALEKEYLTKNMRDKCIRVSSVNDINVFLRAQDYTDYALQTLSCRHLEGLWYEISYRFYEHSEIVRIPLRLDNLSREPRITYVVPLWGGQEYGDSLFQVTPVKIEDDEPDSFLRTFYQVYTNLYVIMPDTLDIGLSHLREMYCTSDFKMQFDSLKQYYKEYDGILTYDALVDNSDFDAFWKSSLGVERKDSLQYQVSYKMDKSWEKSFLVYLKKEGGGYKIDRIVDDF